jgi:hypothetical protein
MRYGSDTPEVLANPPDSLATSRNPMPGLRSWLGKPLTSLCGVT